MAKRHGVISGKNEIKHPHKTKKRLEIKRKMLAARKTKKSK